MATSMVKGNPVKLMLSFAFPLLIGNLLQQTYNIIDAAIVGQALGPEGLARGGGRLRRQRLCKQQFTVSGARLLYGKLHRIQCSGCQVFRRRKA